MDSVRFGLGVRALRRRKGWSLERLGEESRTSRSAVQRVERGRADRVPVHVLERIAASIGAAVTVRLTFQGEALDRLLDQAHADIVEATLTWLRARGWDVATEVSFNVRGERGSIDILAVHRSTRTLLVVEVKSVVPDLQSMLHRLDLKVRLAPTIARDRGWSPVTVARLLVLPDDRTSRRRVTQHAGTFDTALPARTVEVRRWVQAPMGSLAGILFLAPGGQARTPTRHRVSPQR
jgi:transcriptional regulator with XRE-family HTH domain